MIKKVFKNRTSLGVFSIILALIISFGITPLINKKTSSQVEIVRVNKDIKQGEEITSDKISKVKVGAYNLPPNVIKNEQELLTKFAKVDMYKGDFFFKEKVSDMKKMDDHYLYNTYNPKIAISATIKSDASGLSGKLQEGDIVTVIGKTDANPKLEIIQELMYVRVLSTTVKGVDKNQAEEGMPNTITFSVNDIQAEKIAELEHEGEMHIALVYRGEEEMANAYLDLQQEYFLFLEENGLIDGIYEVDKDYGESYENGYEYESEEEYLNRNLDIQSNIYKENEDD